MEDLELDDLDDLKGLFQAEPFCDFMLFRSFLYSEDPCPV